MIRNMAQAINTDREFINNIKFRCYCFVHPIFSSFDFWYFDHISCVIFILVFSVLPLQNENKDYIMFLNFRNFVAKSDQKPKSKNGMNETYNTKMEVIGFQQITNQILHTLLPSLIFIAAIICHNDELRSSLS